MRKNKMQLRDMQVTTTELSCWTGLEFDRALFESHPLRFYDGPEYIGIEQRRELMKKHGDTLELDAGIVSHKSIAAAREKLPLDVFYELIDEVSWV